MSPDSKVWIYQSSREFTENEKAEIMERGAAFVSGWNAHGRMLKAAIEVLHKRFILFTVDESYAMATGCSIDKSVAFIKDIEKAFSINLLDRMQIAYKNNNTINTTSLSDFENLLKTGLVNENTIVYNNLVATQSEFETSWETTVKESWHKALLP